MNPTTLVKANMKLHPNASNHNLTKLYWKWLIAIN